MRRSAGQILVAALLAASSGAHAVEDDGGDGYAPMNYAMHGLCAKQVPGFGEQVAPSWARYRQRHAAIIQRLDTDPAARLHEEVPRPLTPAELADLEAKCSDLASRGGYDIHPADPRLATPAETWKTFVDALKAGDRRLALWCTAADGFRRMRDVLAPLSDAGLRKQGNSYGEFKTIDLYDGIKRGEVVQGDKVFSFRFVLGQHEWRLADF